MSEQTHDFSYRGWGRDYTIDPIDGTDGRQAKMTGWHRDIKTGDFLILQNGSATTRYQVDCIEYERDPQDMFHALVWFAPRSG